MWKNFFSYEKITCKNQKLICKYLRWKKKQGSHILATILIITYQMHSVANWLAWDSWWGFHVSIVRKNNGNGFCIVAKKLDLVFHWKYFFQFFDTSTLDVESCALSVFFSRERGEIRDPLQNWNLNISKHSASFGLKKKWHRQGRSRLVGSFYKWSRLSSLYEYLYKQVCIPTQYLSISLLEDF